MSKAGNGRYINADNYEERLLRLMTVYEAEGQTADASAVAVAIRMLQTERAFERVDVRNHRLLPERDMIDDNYKERLKVRMAEDLGKYAVEEGLATFDEAPDWTGGELRMRAAFLRPIEPKFKPPEQEGGEQE